MRVLISGSGGTLASAFGRGAAAQGHQVVGLIRARDSAGAAGFPQQELPLLPGPVAATLEDFRPDVVFHGAGASSVPQSFVEPERDFESSLGTWQALLEGVRLSDLRPLVIFPSSAAVYGNSSNQPIAESSAISPVSPYGFHKAACELLAREYAECFGMRLLVPRIFSIFGSSQRRLLIWDIYKQCVGSSHEVMLAGTPEASRDYLSMDDAVRAMLGLASSDLGSAGSATFLNLASGQAQRLGDVAKRVVELAGVACPVRFSGTVRRGDPVRWQAQITELCNHLPSWAPRPFDEELSRCISTWNSSQGAR